MSNKEANTISRAASEEHMGTRKQRGIMLGSRLLHPWAETHREAHQRTQTMRQSAKAAHMLPGDDRHKRDWNKVPWNKTHGDGPTWTGSRATGTIGIKGNVAERDGRPKFAMINRGGNTALNRATHEQKGQTGTSSRRLRQTRITQSEEGNLLWGDDPYSISAQEGSRLVYQNINGISKLDQYIKAQDVGEAAAEIGAHIVGLCETNIDWKARDVTDTVRNIFRRYWKHFKVVCFVF